MGACTPDPPARGPHSVSFAAPAYVFPGADTHLNLYRNTHESIFLSFLLLKSHGQARMSALDSLHASRQLGEKCLFPLS